MPPNSPVQTAPERQLRMLAASLAILTGVGFATWAYYLHILTKPPSPGTIDVTSASWGENCGAPKDNVLYWVRSACSGKRKCDFAFDWRLLGNPATTCDKQFRIEWRCSPGDRKFERSLPSDPPQSTIIPLTCSEPEN